ncbi:hypothetical protein ASE66_03005 [Bosea sp. Root483D1]|uniref:hypothetical protein n=1 Tax=Bosea sp. Root483D1 TaxID=1736544 RepID=UPI00070E9C32|nr:hypothetical protein [Bosea sp. Root483D1]KRE24229.1 hypothetical protein ASE66_03005 [Bosea sp. Root483D1]
MIPVAMSPASRSRRFRQWRDIGLIAGLALCSGLLTLASLPGPAVGASPPLAAIFPPWVSGDEAVARSLATGARILRQGAVPFVVVLAPETATRPSGALLMLRLDGLAGCIISPETEASRL